jgi:hypothetical protein
MHWWLYSLGLWSDGIAKAFTCSGAGSHVQDDRRYRRNCAP